MLKIGNRVLAPRGIGIIVTKGIAFDWGVEHNRKFEGGHDLDGRCKIGYGRWYNERDLKKLGGTMSKYDELKGRIEALDNGWDKEADDMLQEIGSKLRIQIPCSSDDTRWGIFIHNAQSISQQHFMYGSQCEKMEAFKKALLWLLDHSDIKKDLVGSEVKADIEGKTYKVKVLGYC